MPVDGPAEEGPVDHLHENEGDDETGDGAEGDARGAEIPGFGHDHAKNMATAGAGGPENTYFPGALSHEGGQGQRDAQSGDPDGEGAEEFGDGK